MPWKSLPRSSPAASSLWNLRSVRLITPSESERPSPYGDGLSLSDGVINLTLLKFHSDDAAGDERGKEFHGIHHMGFIVDDLEKYSELVKKNGGRFHRELKGGGGVDFERKFRDPNGIVFDLSHKGWVGIK